MVPVVREAYDKKGLSSGRNRMEECRTYPLYKFVRGELGTQMLSGVRTVSPGTEIQKLIRPLLQCVQGWNAVFTKNETRIQAF
jgi:phenylalanine ammonia-lyase